MKIGYWGFFVLKEIPGNLLGKLVGYLIWFLFRNSETRNKQIEGKFFMEENRENINLF